MDKFELHGRSDFHIEDKILIVEGYGPWNVESIMDAKKRLVPLISKLSTGQWGVLVILYGEAIYVPDAANYLVESIKELKKIGRTASAIMVEEANQPDFAKRHMSDIFGQAGETFDFFEQKEEAIQWLMQKITEAEKSFNPRR